MKQKCRRYADRLFVLAVATMLLPPTVPAADAGEAPPASVAEPRTLAVAELPRPFDWTSARELDAELVYRVDLDLLAPLGTGEGNLAVWLARFTNDGRGRREWTEAQARTHPITLGNGVIDWQILPADDPLLLAAEGWVDQNECRFYPDVLALQGFDTPIPDLRIAQTLGRSWIVRGRMRRRGPGAKADVRRAIRLGRLLLQDDATVYQNLTGIALIHAGAEALYELAVDAGDAVSAVLATLALADSTALRTATLRRSAISGNVAEHVVEPPIFGALVGPVLDIRDDEISDVITLTESVSGRAHRLEAMTALYVVEHMGTRSQSERAAAVLKKLAGDPDLLVAETAEHLRRRKFDKSELFVRMHVID